MSKHTPGPWAWKNEQLFGRDRVSVCASENTPDARLIAAAPDLLEALQEVLAAADGGGWSAIDPSFKKQRDAIAKATGVAA